MNYAIRLQNHLPAGTEIEAPHPRTGAWTKGVVRGTWSDTRKGLDIGAYVQFEGEDYTRQISSKFIHRVKDDTLVVQIREGT